MAARTLICFPLSEAPGLRAEAAQLALGLSVRGDQVLVFGPLGPWRHALRLAGVAAHEFHLPDDERKFTRAVQDEEPQVIHTFGAEAAHLALPLTLLVGAGGVATLGHDDLTRLNPASLRLASTVFVPCEHLREQVARRLPSVPVIPTGYLLPPADLSAPQHRFLAEEIGIADGAPVVLLGDHFRNGETSVAQALIEATPEIARRVPGVHVVIAGKGIRLAELEGQACDINNTLGYRAVLLPGHRDDMAQLLTLAQVAVGSGRFAAEAQGAGVALVAAGHSGLVGTVTDENRQVAEFTCYGRHGHLEPVTPRALACEITGLFTYEQYRTQFAHQGQERVLATSERSHRAAQIATYYTHSAPSSFGVRPPQRITAVLPEDLRELLFCLPSVGALHDHFPLAHVTLIAAPQHSALLQQTGVAEMVMTKPQRLREWPALLRQLRQRADLCLSFAEDAASMFIAGCTRAPHRLGFADGGSSILLSDHLHARTAPSPARALMLVHGLGIGTGARVASFPMPDHAQETAEQVLHAAGIQPDERILFLCPQAESTHRWHRSHWATLARQLAEERSERIVVLGDGDFELPAHVVKINLPEDSLHLAALLARALVVVAPDSGVLHLADLLGVPTVGLFGPTVPETGSLPNELRAQLCRREFTCRPCAQPCEERRCLRAISPAEVVLALAECCPREMVAA